MPSQLDIDAAALQKMTNKDVLKALLEAKRESDRRNYAKKTSILRQLLSGPNREDFTVDSEENGVVGLTHKPLNFKIHMIKNTVPDYGTLSRLSVKKAVAEAGWDVAAETDALIDSHGDLLLLLKEATTYLPLFKDYPVDIWYNLDTDKVAFHGEELPVALFHAWERGLDKQADFSHDLFPDTYFDEPWALLKSGNQSRAPIIKGITDNWALTDGPVNKWYGGARPLSSMLVGGLAGAGLGYLGGTIGEAISDGNLQRGRLRRTLALMGALGGIAPGAIWGGYNMSQYGPKGIVSDSDGQVKLSGCQYRTIVDSVKALMPEAAEKIAMFEYGSFGNPITDKPINVDDFNNVVWSTNDPYSPFHLRASASGLINAASQMTGGSNLVSPADVASMAVGMGSGYLAGSLVGRTLGALAGLKPESQETLQRAGMWSGMLKTVVPLAFGTGGNPF